MTNGGHQYLGAMPVADLVPYARNARQHSPEQIQQIAKSITEFGFINPIIIDDASNIIAGHGRILAAELLGLASVPAILVDYLTEAQRKAYILADNQIALNSTWDMEMLRVEISDLEKLDIDALDLGFSPEELQEIRFDDGAEIEFPDLGGPKEPFQQRTFVLHDTQAPIVEAAIKLARDLVDAENPNPNKNGAALALICKEYIDSHGDS